ncbi:N-acetyltransferase [Psychromonas marina]|uniref:N-acetyltransferase n=1 Tax=Psychromonas marina TaxID=88364 RepID=A0ABQ6E4S8_9GAMM|nr:GNAT family N-acetyltransferase [Psychromonas marina]GLS92419.1 N-acetyltransferase [Psychromonas marina]
MYINIKRATSENLNEVSELFNDYRVFYKQDDDLELAVSFIAERLKNKDSVIFYAYDENDNALGFTQLYPTFSSLSAASSWVLNDLYVTPSARRLGVGKKLMDTAKLFAIESNAKGIALETAEDNVNAQALYESLGYEKEVGFYNYFLTL